MLAPGQPAICRFPLHPPDRAVRSALRLRRRLELRLPRSPRRPVMASSSVASPTGRCFPACSRPRTCVRWTRRTPAPNGPTEQRPQRVEAVAPPQHPPGRTQALRGSAHTPRGERGASLPPRGRPALVSGARVALPWRHRVPRQLTGLHPRPIQGGVQVRLLDSPSTAPALGRDLSGAHHGVDHPVTDAEELRRLEGHDEVVGRAVRTVLGICHGGDGGRTRPVYFA